LQNIERHKKKKDSGFGVRLDCGFGKVVGLCLEIAVGEGLKKKGRWHLGLECVWYCGSCCGCGLKKVVL
jgi:hypothetical protein